MFSPIVAGMNTANWPNECAGAGGQLTLAVDVETVKTN